MKKEIIRRSNVQLPCGQARPGANLSFLKNMTLFCREFNEKTQQLESGKKVSVEITVLKNSYQFRIKGRVSSDLLKEAIGEKKEITQSELEKISQEKLIYLNTDDLTQAKKIIAGTARSAGIKII